MEDHWCQLSCKTPRIHKVQCSDDSSKLSFQESLLYLYSHYCHHEGCYKTLFVLCLKASCLKAPQSFQQCSFGLRTIVCDTLYSKAVSTVEITLFTAWYPQTNGQTEQVNQELKQYLQTFINEQQSNWQDLLLLVDFQHNNHIHFSTQQLLFLLDTAVCYRWNLSYKRENSSWRVFQSLLIA